MVSSSPQPRSDQRGSDRELHGRLLAGDPVATSDLADGYLRALVRNLRRRFAFVEPHLVEEVAIDSVLRLAREPARYDADRAGLLTYLGLDAAGDLRNLLVAERRRWRRQVSLDDDAAARSRQLSGLRGGSDPVEALTDASEAAALLAELERHLTACERAFVELMLEGERRTPIFAKLIGVTDRPAAEQAREVKRWKDRLTKRLRRRLKLGGPHG